MSQDIRSFFSSKKSAAPTQQGHKRTLTANSDDGKSSQESKSSERSKKRRIIDDDDDGDAVVITSAPSSSKKINLSKLKESERKGWVPVLDVNKIFESKPLKENSSTKAVSTVVKNEIGFEDDIDDMDVVELEKSLLAATSEMETSLIKKSPIKKVPKVETNADQSIVAATPENKKNHKPNSKKTTENNHEDDVQNDIDRHDRKRQAAMMYQKFKNRGGATNPGSKEIPKGKPNCLNGLSFVVTGVLESLEREEASALIKELGGKVTTALSKKTQYMVVGEEAGLAKLSKAEEYNTTILTEDDLLNLIRTNSGLATNVKLNNSNEAVKKEPVSTPSKSKSIKSETQSPSSKEEKSAKRIKLEPASTPPKSKIMKLETGSPSPKKEKHIKIETVTYNNAVIKKNNLINESQQQPWVEKYKPKSVKDIVGQQGASSNVAKLQNWLTKWYINHDGKKKPARPNPWAKNDDGAFYKAALLSGPPGVGKTTTATLVCKELGFDTVEFNASDTRSKRLLKEEVSELLSNQSLHGYFTGGDQRTTIKHVLIMDEVDGMAGNEDRGGVQELIALIKDSSVPIICMCNDRNHQKMRSLVNYCFDLRFSRPRVEQIKAHMLSICFKEGMKMAPTTLQEIILATNNDIRQTINHLTLLSANKSLSLNNTESTAKKDLKLGPWEVVRKVFSAEEHKTMTLYDKADLFFNDYSMGPLFVQQNYLCVTPAVPKDMIPRQIALTADSLSRGDLVDQRIRSKMAWSMLPLQAMYSSFLPGEYMKGRFTGQINFPGWLGKYSKANKRNRLAQEIHDHTRIGTSGSKLSIRLDYAPFLIDKIIRPLRERGIDGVQESLVVLKEYRLLREDIDSLIELTTWPGKKSPMDAIDAKVKAALTRAYNKEVAPYSYSATAAIKKKKSEANTDDDYEGYVENEDEAKIVHSSDDEDDMDVKNDVLIKAKQTKTKSDTVKTKKKTTAKTPKPANKSKSHSKSSKLA